VGPVISDEARAVGRLAVQFGLLSDEQLQGVIGHLNVSTNGDAAGVSQLAATIEAQGFATATDVLLLEAIVSTGGGAPPPTPSQLVSEDGGRRLGEFRILRELGRGAMGVCCRRNCRSAKRRSSGSGARRKPPPRSTTPGS
jgi:hypothetical protein